MEQIIKGSALGAYITTGAALGNGSYKDASGNDVTYKFVKLDVRDQYSPNAQHRSMVLFCSSSPEIDELYDILKPHLKKDNNGAVVKDRQGCGIIDWRKMKKEAVDDYEELKEAGWTIFPGADVVNVPLRKGSCYRNDKDGNIILDKNGNQIIADTISILVIVKDIRQTQDGPQPTYLAGWDPITQRDQMEQRFYMKPCTTASAHVETIPPMSAAQAQVPPSVAPQQPTAPAPASDPLDEY